MCLAWTRVTTDQGDLGEEVDQGGQGDEDYLGVLYCTVLGCGGLKSTVLGSTELYWAVLGRTVL